MRLIALITLTLFTATTAQAQKAAVPDPPPRALEGGHLAGAYLTGLATELALGALGGQIGRLAAGDCREDSNNDWSCFLHGLGEVVIGASVGASAGAATGVYGYGAATDHQGSFWGALGGSTAVFAAAVLIGAAADSEGSLLVGGLLMPVGAIIGYNLGAPSVHEAPRAAALLDVTPTHGVRLGAPSLRWSRIGDDERWSTTLVSGRF
jgi:hypothetical protein